LVTGIIFLVLGSLFFVPCLPGEMRGTSYFTGFFVLGSLFPSTGSGLFIPPFDKLRAKSSLFFVYPKFKPNCLNNFSNDVVPVLADPIQNILWYWSDSLIEFVFEYL
jgi:hypothetical protein